MPGIFFIFLRQIKLTWSGGCLSCQRYVLISSSLQSSRQEFRKILHRLAASGAEGIILGCTEISLLVQPEDSPVPLFDTTEIHARRAAEMALEGEVDGPGDDRTLD